MSSPFERLPPELQILILESMEVDEEGPLEEFELAKHTYRALCLTSKTLQDVAEPFLYRHFRRTEDDSWIKGLLKTLSERSSSAQLLHNIDMDTSDATQPPLTNEELMLFTKHLDKNEIGRKYYHKITKALSRGCCTAQMVAILATAKHIRRVWFLAHEKVECAMCKTPLPWIYALFATPEARAGYRKLHTLQLCGMEGNGGVACLDAFPALQLPVLRHFTGHGLKSVKGDVLQTPALPSSTLQLIQIVGSNINTQAAQAIISSTRVLTELQIRWNVTMNQTADGHVTHEVDPPAILEALSAHQNSLEILILENGVDSSVVFRDRPALGRLTGFTTLTTIGIDENLLRGGTGWSFVDLGDVLPGSLQHFVLFTYGSLDALADICKAMTGFKGEELQCISINFNYDADEAVGAMMREYWDYGKPSRSTTASVAYVVPFQCDVGLLLNFCYHNEPTGPKLGDVGNLLAAQGVLDVLRRMMVVEMELKDNGTHFVPGLGEGEDEGEDEGDEGQVVQELPGERVDEEGGQEGSIGEVAAE